MQAALLVWMGAMVVAGCRGTPQGDESLEELREVFRDEGHRCLEHDPEACQWVKAYLDKDLAEASAACEAGDTYACQAAHLHHDGRLEPELG